ELENDEHRDDRYDIGDPIRAVDYGTLLERLFRWAEPDVLAEPVVTDCIRAVEHCEGGALRLRTEFVDHLGGIETPFLAQVLGRCAVNVDWETLDEWLEIEPHTLELRVRESVY